MIAILITPVREIRRCINIKQFRYRKIISMKKQVQTNKSRFIMKYFYSTVMGFTGKESRENPFVFLYCPLKRANFLKDLHALSEVINPLLARRSVSFMCRQEMIDIYCGFFQSFRINSKIQGTDANCNCLNNI